jgi:hypothetical protein
VIIHNDLDANAETWQQLLNDKHTAERDLDMLATRVVRDHDDNHAGNLRWCQSEACRMVAERLK